MRTSEFTLYLWLEYEDANEDEDTEKWNEMDFEVVIEASRNSVMEPALEVSSQFLADSWVPEASPLKTGSSSVEHLAGNQSGRACP